MSVVTLASKAVDQGLSIIMSSLYIQLHWYISVKFSEFFHCSFNFGEET